MQHQKPTDEVYSSRACLPCKRVKASFACQSPSSHGEIVVFEEAKRTSSSFVVAWRRDRRHSKKIHSISSFRDRQDAIRAAWRYSNVYIPSPHHAYPRTNRRRDYQRTAVYNWENSLLANFGTVFSLQNAKDLAALITNLLRIPPVPVSCGSARLSQSSYFSPASGIVLSPNMVDMHTLLHELSHYIVYLMRINEPSHGPTFVSSLMFLFIIAIDLDKEYLTETAREKGVAFDIDILHGLLKLVRIDTTVF